MTAFLLLLAGLLATATAVAVDLGGERRGLLPPGFVLPGRRFAATILLTVVLGLGVFLPLFSPRATELDLSTIGWMEMFGFQIILLISLGIWYVLGYFKAGMDPAPKSTLGSAVPPDMYGSSTSLPSAALESEIEFSEEPVEENRLLLKRRRAKPVLALLGLSTRRIEREITLGLLAGFAAWLVVLVATAVLAGVFQWLGFGEALGLESAPSPLIVWLAAQPIWVRCLISLAAGVSEELFFRGFLQPRIGIVMSTALFVAGHAGYGQPMMLVGITLLSLLYAQLYRWRGNVWAAMVAHTLFDAIQLLLVIPAALKAMELTA